jgi:ABC-type branched-subunit amino acid transport system substrate-binding protein
MGPYGSGIAMASTTIAERHRYVVILPLNDSDELYNRGYKYIYSVLPSPAGI